MSTEENKALVRRGWEEHWNTGNSAVVDELFAPNYVGHNPSGPPTQGPGAHKQFALMYRSAFPDLHITIEELIAEGEKVVTRFTSRGTHQGALLGIPPTGKQVTVTGITIDRFEGGKVVESWSEFDLLGMMQQVGAIPMPGQTS